MKLFCHGLLWIGIVSLVSVGCEPHSFEDTKVLHEGHGGGHGDDHGHGDGHGEDHGHGDHAKDDHHDDDHAKGDDHHKDEEKPKADKKEAKAEKKADEPRDAGL